MYSRSKTPKARRTHSRSVSSYSYSDRSTRSSCRYLRSSSRCSCASSRRPSPVMRKRKALPTANAAMAPEAYVNKFAMIKKIMSNITAGSADRSNRRRSQHCQNLKSSSVHRMQGHPSNPPCTAHVQDSQGSCSRRPLFQTHSYALRQRHGNRDVPQTPCLQQVQPAQRNAVPIFLPLATSTPLYNRQGFSSFQDVRHGRNMSSLSHQDSSTQQILSSEHISSRDTISNLQQSIQMLRRIDSELTRQINKCTEVINCCREFLRH